MKYIKYIVWLLLTVAVLFLFIRFAGSFFVVDFMASKSDDKEESATLATIGKEAPYFSLSKISGGNVNRSDILGAPVILVFWATWNSESADQIKILDDYQNHPKSAPVRAITINSQEDRSTAASFLRRGGYGVEALLDQTGEVGNRYGIQTLPVIFFIDNNGIVQDVFTGVMNETTLVDKVEKMLQ